ncbi:MAG TPA: hypothetical protein VJL62_04045 [Thermodesulfobacteriota bacterium]|nr:hypothetical protein [Thermodesulfobacteriota bacterium]
MMKFRPSILIFSFITVSCVLTTAASPADKPTKDNGSSMEDIIPLTAANIRGHKMLYTEGWFVVSSSEKAIEYAKEKSIISSKMAIKRAIERSAEHSIEYAKDVKSDVKEGVETGKGLFKSGTKQSVDILKGTQTLAEFEYAYAKEGFRAGWGRFIQGNITLRQRTEEDFREMASLPKNYFGSLKSDFSNLLEITESVNDRFARNIDTSWEAAFGKASKEFKAEYERSGEEKNSLTALGPILYGYLKAFYHGLAAPVSKNIVKAGVSGGTHALFLPVAATSVAGRTVQSAGLTIYYTTKTGVNIVSPTVEAGLLTSMALLSAGSVPVTYVAGASIGAINQVTYSTAGPVYGVGEGTVKTAADTGKYVGFLLYDGIKETIKVAINQAQSGVVLGYNAATAIPAHLLMGTVDGAIFLAWDGPRLVIAAAKGDIGGQGEVKASAGELPVGSVVDLNRLREAGGVDVTIISEDPAVIKDALEKLPCDLREGGGTCE